MAVEFLVPARYESPKGSYIVHVMVQKGTLDIGTLASAAVKRLHGSVGLFFPYGRGMLRLKGGGSLWPDLLGTQNKKRG